MPVKSNADIIVKTKKAYRRIAVLLFVVYCLLLFKLLFFKATINFSDIVITGNENSSFDALLAASNFIPFYKIYYYLSGSEPYLVGALNIVGNLLLFVPMGFFLPFLFKGIKSGKQLFFLVALMSLSVEVLQLFTTTGEFDIDDVLLNTGGAMIGYGLFCKLRKLVVARQEK